MFSALTLVNCASTPPEIQQPGVSASDNHPPSWQPPGEISVLIWNLGFGALGEGAEFFPDGGRRLIPSARREVLRYVDGIGAFLQSVQADVFLFQEAALPSAVNHRVDLLGELSARLPGRWCSYSPEVQIRFPAVSVGAASFAPGPPLSIQRLELPREDGGGRQFFHLLIARFAVPGGELVLGNLHLAAFDREAGLRREQLQKVADFLRTETSRGNHVVLGGDWNLLLADTRFPHTTEQRHLQWIHPLPPDFPPPGFRFAVDETTATVRTLERPYLRGENYTGIIDGLLVSANVEVIAVRGFDLGFRFSDHQPVLVHLRLD